MKINEVPRQGSGLPRTPPPASILTSGIFLRPNRIFSVRSDHQWVLSLNLLPPLMPVTDSELLQRFATAGSEPAFHELVQRHLPLVWGTARRVANGDAALAEDISQIVFADLARQAGKLRSGAVVGAWLHRHTHFIASKAVRTEVRRRTREQNAIHLHAMPPYSDSDPLPAGEAWANLAPHLDPALDALPAADREAVVLRFFEHQDLRTIGERLGISEEAARKRVARALERLRAGLTKRGAVLTVAVLGALLTEHAAAAVPANLAKSVAATALERWLAGSAGSAGTLSSWLRHHGARTAGMAAAVLVLGGGSWVTWTLLSAKPAVAPVATVTRQTAPAVAPAGRAWHFTVEAFVIPDKIIAATLLRRGPDDPDADLLARCRALAAAGQGEALPVMALDCDSGARKKAEDVFPVEFGVEWDAPSVTPVDQETKNTGTTAELECVITNDRKSAEVKLAWHYIQPEVFWTRHPTFAVASQQTDDTYILQPQFRTLKSSCQISVNADQPVLVTQTRLEAGTWMHASPESRRRKEADPSSLFFAGDAETTVSTQAWRNLVFLSGAPVAP